MVGTSGNRGTRLSVVTAKVRSLPDCMPALAEARSAKITWVSPAIVPVIAGAAPRNGMLVMSTPAMALNSSSASKVAVPPEAWLSLPGLALACAISSRTVFTGRPSCTSSTSGIAVISATGSKSRCEW